MDIPGKVKVLRTNLIDYLENHLASRLEQTQLDMRIIQPDAPEEQIQKDKPADFSDASFCAPSEKSTENSPAFTPSEAEELELLLKEFLT